MRDLRGAGLLLLVPPALVVALALDQGGFDPSAWVWAGAIAAWAAALTAALAGELTLPRGGALWAGAALAVLAWTAAATLWSDRRTQTVLEARRTAVYAAVVLVLVVVARRRSGRALLTATHAALAATTAYALARYLVGPRHADTFEGTLLAQPVGYANGIAVLAALGAVLAVGLVPGARTARARAAFGAMLPIFAAALALTHSRGAVVALAAGLVVTALGDEGWAVVRTVVTAVPAAGVAAAVAALSRLSDDHSDPWAHAGLVVAAATVVCAAVSAAALARPRPQRRHATNGAVVATACVLVAAAVAAVVARTGSAEPRSSLWHVAWQQFTEHRLAGAGAGTYALAWARSGLAATRGGALDTHSLYLETLAELGVVGLVLLLVFLLQPLSRPRSLRSSDAAAAAGGYVVFLVHAGLDWDWELPAVVVAGLCCGAAALAASRGEGAETSPRGRIVVVALAIVLGALSIAGARSGAEPGVAPRQPLVAVGVRVAVPLALAVPVVPVGLRRGDGAAGRGRVTVAQVRLQRLRGDGDHHPRMLLGVGAVADRDAVLPARRAVLVLR